MVAPRECQFNHQHSHTVGRISFMVTLFFQNRLNDLSVVNDFISETFAQNLKMEVLTIENAPAVLGHCLTLVNSKYESHAMTGIKAFGTIFNVFRDVSLLPPHNMKPLQRIMQAKSSIVNERFVDLQRENRMQNYDLLIDQFEKAIAAPGWDRALKSTNQ